MTDLEILHDIDVARDAFMRAFPFEPNQVVVDSHRYRELRCSPRLYWTTDADGDQKIMGMDLVVDRLRMDVLRVGFTL